MKTNRNDTENQVPALKSFIFRLGLAEVLRLTMMGILILIARDIIRLPLHLPGHTSIFWMGILVLGKGIIPKFGAGIIMGTVSGALAMLLGEGKEGILVFFWYFMPGLSLDLLLLVFNFKLESPIAGAIGGALASLVKLATNFTVGVILKLPMTALTLGLGVTVLFHALFGAAGGVIAVFLIKRLRLINSFRV